MRILKEDTVGLIVDMQEKLFPHMQQHEELQQSIRTLISGLRVLEVPILLTEQYTKGLGETILPVKEILGDVEPTEKMCFSCCDEPAFFKELKSMECNNVILAGIETHVCILQTAIDLLDRSFQPIIVADCVSSRKTDDKVIALQRLAKEGAIITTKESILFELCRYAGTDQFKSISKLVK